MFNSDLFLRTNMCITLKLIFIQIVPLEKSKLAFLALY